MTKEARTKELKKINDDLEALQKHITQYISQLASKHYLAGKPCKELLERDLLPYIALQLDEFMNDVEPGKTEVINVFWLSKLLDQTALPSNIHEKIAEEIKVIHKGLYTPGLVLQEMGRNYSNPNIIINNTYDITKLIETTIKIKLLEYIATNFNIVQDYIQANQTDINQHYKELKNIDLKWIQKQFNDIKTIAVQPHKHVKPTTIAGPVPAPLTTAPKVGGEPVKNAETQRPIEAPPSPRLVNTTALRSFFQLPPLRPTLPVSTSQRHHPLPPAATLPSWPIDDVEPVLSSPRPVAPLSPWKQFWQTHRSTSLAERFGIMRLFKYNNSINPAPRASFFMNLVYRFLFWTHLPIINGGLNILRDGFVAVAGDCKDFVTGKNRFSSLFSLLLKIPVLALFYLHAPFVLVGTFLLGLTSLPIIMMQRLIELSPLPRLIQASALAVLLFLDAAKDILCAAAGVFLWSKILGLGLTAMASPAAILGANLLPLLSVPFAPLFIASAAAVLLVVPVAAFLLSGRTLQGLSGLFRQTRNHGMDFMHSADVENELSHRLDRTLNTSLRMDHDEILPSRNSIRFNARNQPTSRHDDDVDAEIPLQRKRRIR